MRMYIYICLDENNYYEYKETVKKKQQKIT